MSPAVKTHVAILLWGVFCLRNPRLRTVPTGR
jgi:hypothetical protein